MTNVEAKLRSVHAELEFKCDSKALSAWIERYRLDDLWILNCHFHYYVSNTLIETKLTQKWRTIELQPPPHFTGVWTTYYANGQKLHQTRYKDGDYDGDDIGYYPSGRVSCWSTRKGKKGEPVGTGTAYKEDGTVLPQTNIK
jgi:antitoxin component YwqK of YwqJK toxin-antitoxin module